MKVLGLDPGAQSGWCIYDVAQRKAIASGLFAGHLLPLDVGDEFDVAVIERPKGYGPTYPQVVDCGYVCGRLVQMFVESDEGCEEMTRHDVCRTLSDATHGTVHVKNDATAWAALKLLHGEGCDKKGGCLHGVKAHARAALAVAVAYALRIETSLRAV